MKAGSLRNRVTIQENATLKDNTGSQKPVWVDVFSTHAAIKPLSGRELIASQAENSEISVRIVIRYRTGVTASMRVVHGETIYAIVSPPINTDMRNTELQIMCAAGLNKG
jgi:SPP1 family predicted phage head-tail adaptor